MRNRFCFQNVFILCLLIFSIGTADDESNDIVETTTYTSESASYSTNSNNIVKSLFDNNLETDFPTPAPTFMSTGYLLQRSRFSSDSSAVCDGVVTELSGYVLGVCTPVYVKRSKDLTDNLVRGFHKAWMKKDDFLLNSYRDDNCLIPMAAEDAKNVNFNPETYQAKMDASNCTTTPLSAPYSSPVEGATGYGHSVTVDDFTDVAFKNPGCYAMTFASEDACNAEVPKPTFFTATMLGSCSPSLIHQPGVWWKITHIYTKKQKITYEAFNNPKCDPGQGKLSVPMTVTLQSVYEKTTAGEIPSVVGSCMSYSSDGWKVEYVKAMCYASEDSYERKQEAQRARLGHKEAH